MKNVNYIDYLENHTQKLAQRMNGSFQLSFTKTIPKTEPNSVYVSLSYARTQLYFCLASFGFELDFLSLLVLNCPLGIDSCKLAMIFDKSTHLSWNEISNWTIFYIFSIFSVWFGVACPHATINTKFVIFWAKCMSQLQMEFLFDWLNSFFFFSLFRIHHWPIKGIWK